MNNIFKSIVKAPIKAYRFAISPLFSSSCRFSPTCSAYALEAIDRHGIFKGLALSIWRILRCNPWHKCEHFDPVPERFDWLALIGYKRGKQKENNI